MENKIIAEDFILKKKNKDFKKSIIERQNITNEFTIQDIETHLAELDRMEREHAAQIKVSNAAIENITRNHALVSKLNDTQLAAAEYLFNVKTTLGKSNAKLKEIKATKKKYKEITDTVYQKFGFVESNVMESKDE